MTFQPVIGGVTRTAIVHVPTGYRPGKAVPLVLNLHGSQSTAAAQEAFTGMDATADADDFLVAYPQGDISAATGFEWNVPNEPLLGGGAVPATAPNDVTFLEQFVSLLEKDYCVDEHRVYATGFSGGARMASQLACDASQTFAAVAPVSGLRLPSPCPATRAVPVLSFHGTSDPVDPYSGNGQAYWTYSVPVAAARWGVQDGCSPTAGTLNPSKTVVVTTYSNCSDGAVVQLYTIVGEGHEWPGGPKLPRSTIRVLGPQSTAVSANATMWSFFVAHPLAS
jgi:polyhydroxybutyrate depolymerase